MSLFKSKETIVDESTQFVKSLILPNEELENLFVIGMEFIAVTNLRLIVKDREGIFDKSAGIISIPISKISAVCMEQSITKLAPVVPTIKIYGSGISVMVRGLEKDAVLKAYQTINQKVLFF